MKRCRISTIDKMISELESHKSLGRDADSYKNMAISYLKSYADSLEARGFKTIPIKENVPQDGNPNRHKEK